MDVTGLRIWVVGDGPLADDIRHELTGLGALVVGDDETTIDACVFAPWQKSAMTPIPFENLTDENFDQAWQQTMDWAVATCTEAREKFQNANGGTAQGSVVLTTFTTGFAGGSHYAHWAAAAEGVHILTKSIARQWGPEGISVNCVALAPEDVLADAQLAGPISIATPANPNAKAAKTIAFLCSSMANDLAGQTLTVDGGIWM